jgi:HEAT repeat protein
MSRQRIYILLPCLLLPPICFLVIESCGGGKSNDELIEDLKSGKEKDRIAAVRNLSVQTEDAAHNVPALIDALKDKDGDVRRSAAIKLGVYGEQAREAIPALKFALNDRDVRVRRAAADALAKIDPASAPKNASENTNDR